MIPEKILTSLFLKKPDIVDLRKAGASKSQKVERIA